MSVLEYFARLFSRKSCECEYQKAKKEKELAIIAYLQESCAYAKENSKPLSLGILKVEDSLFHNHLAIFLLYYLHSNNGRYRKDLIKGMDKTVFLIVHDTKESAKKLLEDFIDKSGYFYPKEEQGKIKLQLEEYRSENYKDFLKKVQESQGIEYILNKKN